ncbi:MAG TPA: glyceraldehyde 3-phosphate dehydrogenase NAD-binding domain-containing protein [Thermoanaerobaculia bacterium]|nr:glyceraldehyde 3-phosphate dehydrogenase NAD-binding domain-containing protein [Thermoanaerobaculia bacterium]
MTSVALFGFGRIGRNLFRILHSREDVRIAAIADPAEPEALAYLVRFDTLLGRFPDLVTIRGNHLYVAGRQIPLLTGAEANAMRWKELGVETVLEATSRSRTRAELEKHLESGARRVISLAPPAEPLDLLAVPGLTDNRIDSRQRMVSNASSTVHAVAPVLHILHETLGIRRALFTTVHAYTSQHRLADVPAEDKRRGRAAAENIIPQESRSPAMLDQVLPELAGKITGYAMNVPVQNGSVVDLVCWHEKEVAPEAINEVIRTAAATDRWSRILQYENEPIVSSDVARSSWSSIFDSLATMTLVGRVSKTLSWFDSGYGYAHRAVDLLDRYAALDRTAAARTA